MSHRTLERVYVRMLFDPAFVDAVYADARRALEGLDLEPHERAQLVAVDRRAWGHDPLRRYRTLRTLAEEFKASTTLVLAATRSLGSLDAFFSSVEFHGAVQERGSLALAFAAFLERLVVERPIDTPQLPDALRLERMLARCRRELDAAPRATEPPTEVGGATVLALALGHAVGRFNANVVETVNVAERYLFEVGLMPAVALCEDAPRLDALPPVAAEPAHLLALPSSAGVSLMPLDADYVLLLDRFSDGPLSLSEAAKAAVAAGLPREDVGGMIESLLDERVLRKVLSAEC
jgi:hypothetical protein